MYVVAENYEQTDRYTNTHTRDNYHNPRCACVPRVRNNNNNCNFNYNNGINNYKMVYCCILSIKSIFLFHSLCAGVFLVDDDLIISEEELNFAFNTWRVWTQTHIIVCSRSVGCGLRAEVYVMVECSYFTYTLRLTVCP